MQLAFSIILLLFFTACNSVGTDVKQPEDEKNLADHIRGKAIELDNTDDLAPLISRAADKKLVLLGEASHGTHEYYKWRDLISRRLISEHGFNFILVEGDFASLFELNRYVKDLPGAADTARDVLERLDRWPVWMWSNHETLELAEWLRKHNDSLPAADKVGFYGMDVYDEWRSKAALLYFLREHNEELHGQVSDDYAGFAPYVGNSWNYARDVRAGRVDFSDNPRFDPRQFVRSVVPMRYDALIFFDETAALKPLKP